MVRYFLLVLSTAVDVVIMCFICGIALTLLKPSFSEYGEALSTPALIIAILIILGVVYARLRRRLMRQQGGEVGPENRE